MSPKVADVVIVKDGIVLLVQQRKDSAYGLWSSPGGGVEDGETIEQGVVREVQEELGVALEGYSFFKTYRITTARGDLEIHTFIGSIDSAITLKHDELMAYGWFSVESLGLMGEQLRSPTVLQLARDVMGANEMGR